MNINFFPINFKGYDAAPLKAIHMDSWTSEPIKSELQAIAKEEGFEIRSALDYFLWAQDLKMIVEKDKKPFCVAGENAFVDYHEEIKRKYGISYKINKEIAVGGNTFIGKYPNGEKWMMIGSDELQTKTKDFLAQEYEVKKENIIVIPQQHYHLDMFMRPIGYPYVLIDNPELSRKKLESLPEAKDIYDYLTVTKNFKDYESARSLNYDSHEETIKALEQAGFIPIEVAGVLGSGINFMNAIVNQHQDGSISYITNSSKCNSELMSSFQEGFEKELRQKVPNIDKVYFVSGIDEYNDSTYLIENIALRGGGLHCMTMEEPNFSTWA